MTLRAIAFKRRRLTRDFITSRRGFAQEAPRD
jgi:hypothetical protein